MDVTGRKFLADFGMAKAILYFPGEMTLTFTLTEKEGKQVNIIETVSISLIQIRPQLFMVNWKEENGTTVTQVHDYENGIVYSNWTSPGGDFKSLQGTLTPVKAITVKTAVKATPENCWRLWTSPADILLFNNPFVDWHTTQVEIDLKEGSNFFYRMEAKDGSAGFDFAGEYDKVIPNELIEYTGADGRKATNTFTPDGDHTIITEVFEPETTTPLDVQRDFCQGILDNFKKYAEKVMPH